MATITDSAIRAIKPGDSPQKKAVGGGLVLITYPTGSKLWRLRYRRPNGKETMLSLGAYPDIGLAEARNVANAIRLSMKSGNADPVREKAREREVAAVAEATTFAGCANLYMKKKVWPTKVERHARRLQALLDNDISPKIGAMPVSDIKPADIMRALTPIEKRGAADTAHRALSLIRKVMQYAAVLGIIDADPTAGVRMLLSDAPARKNHPALVRPADVGEFVRKLQDSNMEPWRKAGILFHVYLFQRPSEIRLMQWADIDRSDWVWRFRVTKTGIDHAVPIPTQVRRLLKDLHAVSGGGAFVFPSSGKVRSRDGAMSLFPLQQGIRDMGYDTQKQVNLHGWRATARTLLAERLKYDPRLIELQLAHRPPESHGSAYNRAIFIDERTTMMQSYADYIDRLASEARDGW